MILHEGNMWSAWDKTDHFLITTNGCITYDGRLVMGRGIALEAKNRWPELPYKLAVAIRREGNLDLADRMWLYYVILGKKLGIFQVKRNWQDKASTGIIYTSTCELDAIARELPDESFHLNYPGIGNGKLSIDQVQPIVSVLPDNVHLWTKPS